MVENLCLWTLQDQNLSMLRKQCSNIENVKTKDHILNLSNYIININITKCYTLKSKWKINLIVCVNKVRYQVYFHNTFEVSVSNLDEQIK